MSFAYCTLMGEVMYDYITCRLDIGYSVTNLLKVSYAPIKYYYKLSRMIKLCV